MERLGVSFRDINTAAGPGLSGTTAETGARPVIIAVFVPVRVCVRKPHG
jgi:hypothetical protein